MKVKDFRRYDAWANPILPYDQMLVYYQDDPKSLAVLHNKLPHRYAVIPTVEIHISPQYKTEIYIYYIFPGGTESKVVYPSEHALQALRKAYKGHDGWKGHKDKNGFSVIRRKGCVIALSYSKFGLYV